MYLQRKIRRTFSRKHLVQTYIIIAFSEWGSDPFILNKLSVSTSIVQRFSMENNVQVDTGVFSEYAVFCRESHITHCWSIYKRFSPGDGLRRISDEAAILFKQRFFVQRTPGVL